MSPTLTPPFQDTAEAAELNPSSEIAQLLLTAVQYLWIYDYLLTFGDEVPRVRFYRGVRFLLLRRYDMRGPGGSPGVSMPP